MLKMQQLPAAGNVSSVSSTEILGSASSTENINPVGSKENTSFVPIYNLISRILCIFGCTVYKTPNPNIFLRGYWYLSYTWYVFSVVGTIFAIIATDDLNFKLQSFTFFAGVSSSGYKLGMFWTMRKRHWNLKEIIKKNTTEFKGKSSLEIETCVKNQKKITRIRNILGVCYASTILSFIVFPWLKRNEFVLPVHFKILGIPYLTSPGYDITYAYFFIFISYGVLATFAFDLSFCVICIYVVSRFELCVKYCSLIGDMTGEYKSEEDQRKLIKHIAEIFADAHEFLKESSALYGPGILISAIFSIAMFSSSLGYFIANHFPLEIFGEMIGIGVQYFFYSLFGNLILSKGEEISDAIYCSKWHKLKDISNRKMVLFLLTSSQGCPGFSVGGVTPLSFQSYTRYFKACYGIAACMVNLMS